MKRLLIVAVAVATLVAVVTPTAAEARAHPIHTTLTVVTPTPGGATIMLRAFADDFSAAVARFAGKRPPSDSSASEGDVGRYMAAHLRMSDAANREVTLRPCGVRRANGLFWVCLRVTLERGGRGAVVRNTVLTELHDDQVNVVQVEHREGKRTLLFTRGSAAAAMDR